MFFLTSKRLETFVWPHCKCIKDTILKSSYNVSQGLLHQNSSNVVFLAFRIKTSCFWNCTFKTFICKWPIMIGQPTWKRPKRTFYLKCIWNSTQEKWNPPCGLLINWKLLFWEPIRKAGKSQALWTLRDKLVKHKDCETLWLVLQDCTNDNISRKLHMNHKSSHTRAVWLWKNEKKRQVGVGDKPPTHDIVTHDKLKLSTATPSQKFRICIYF